MIADLWHGLNSAGFLAAQSIFVIFVQCIICIVYIGDIVTVILSIRIIYATSFWTNELSSVVMGIAILVGLGSLCFLQFLTIIIVGFISI